MNRLTRPTEDGKHYIIDEKSLASGEAAERLAMYENAHEQLFIRQTELECELEKLRAEGRQKSGRFKELLARKLINKGVLDLFA